MNEKKDLIELLREDVSNFIERQQELMFNERDFQMQLAVALRASGRYDDVEVEYYIPNDLASSHGYEWNSDLRLDIVVSKGGKFAIVELKYPTRRITTDITRFDTLLPGVEIVKNHGAQDIVSYNYWKDVRRIEIVRSLFPKKIVGGIAVMLTNEKYYVHGPRPGTIFDAFSTADGRSGVHGLLAWTKQTSTSKGLPPFSLQGNYSIKWNPTSIEGHQFFYNLITI